MVGRILPERRELKVGLLTKKSQNKSYFFTTNNYNERVFVLDTHCLAYYSGTLQVGTEVLKLCLLVSSFQRSTSKF